MRRNLLPILAGLLALSIAATSSAAERRKSSEAEAPPQYRIDTATRSMAVTRVVNQVPVGSSVGRYCQTPLCSEGQDILSDYAFSGVPQQEYANIFAQEAQAAGFNVGTNNNDLFATGDSQKSELMVGAAITAFSARGRVEGILVTMGAFLEATISVDWQVFEPLEKKIIYRGSSQGSAHVRTDGGPSSLPRDVARAAFREAAKAVIREPGLLAAVRDPRGGPSAQSGGLFPEASGAAASPSNTVATVQIPRVPLSTKPFRQHVKEIMKQVITVRTGSGNGSGFYIADGLLLTNHHVINGYKDVRIQFFGGREIAGRVIAMDVRRDIALIQTESVGLHGLPLRTEPPELASPTFVIGSPLDPKWEGSVISGIVSGFRDHAYGPMIQSDVQVTHGNSGGPMFDENGNVIALVDIGYSGLDGQATAINLFIAVGDGLAKLNIQASLPAGAAPVLTAASPATQVALSAPAAAPTTNGREIKVSMYPAAGPVKDGGHTAPLLGAVAGVGTSGTFTFARPDGVSCNGKWTTLQSKPQSGSLVDKHRDVIGISASADGMVGGLAIGSCTNAATFQAEYYVVPNVDSGFGAATDSDGNVYKIIF